MFGVDHPIVLIFISAVVGFILKYVWDRWLSQSSRVTRLDFDEGLKSIRNECVLKREGCINERKSNKTYFETLIKQQADFLGETVEADAVTERRRTQTRHVLLCILITQLKICDALNKSTLLAPGQSMDCDEISKMMIELGVIE